MILLTVRHLRKKHVWLLEVEVSMVLLSVANGYKNKNCLLNYWYLKADVKGDVKVDIWVIKLTLGFMLKMVLF